MKTELERQLSSLTAEEKEEAYYFLMPDVLPAGSDPISPELLAELERRLAEHQSDPAGSITLEEFKNLFLPDLAASQLDAELSPELKAELERRIREDDLHPEAAMSFDDFKLRWAHRK